MYSLGVTIYTCVEVGRHATGKTNIQERWGHTKTLFIRGKKPVKWLSMARGHIHIYYWDGGAKLASPNQRGVMGPQVVLGGGGAYNTTLGSPIGSSSYILC